MTSNEEIIGSDGRGGTDREELMAEARAMTAHDARERAWREYMRTPRLFADQSKEEWDACWDAAKREDEQRIAELVNDDATVVRLVKAMRMVPDIVSHTREFTYPDLPNMARAALRALASQTEAGS